MRMKKIKLGADKVMLTLCGHGIHKHEQEDILEKISGHEEIPTNSPCI